MIIEVFICHFPEELLSVGCIYVLVPGSMDLGFGVLSVLFF